MKKIILLLLLPAIFSSFILIRETRFTEEERKFAVDHLKKTQEDLLNAVNGLTEAQLNFKAAQERWSVMECAQHITMASQGLWQLTDATLKQKTDTLKSTVKDDRQFIKMVEDRSMKQKAPEEILPSKSPYHTIAETLDAFKADRSKLIDYIQKTNDDMRSHVAKMPFGSLDSYQLVLLISAHTNRHTQQINEVKTDPNFPK